MLIISDSNIDRILALWQALHPDRYVPEKEKYGFDLKYPLHPFYKGKRDDEVWDSEHARDWTKCGFAVPGTQFIDPSQLKKIVAEYINSNYYWIASRAPPPANFAFPKYLDHVEALIGQPNSPPPPNFEIRAVTAGKNPGFVTRTIALNQNTSTVKDKPAITSDDISNRDDAVFPDGALVGDKQRTWNAHIKVRK